MSSDPGSPLLAVLQSEIAAAGPIPFARYMELCLYHPEWGYYSRGLGGGGGRDYVTSSGLHRAYGALMARQAEEMWHGLGEPGRFRFVEFGPGEGFFAADFLRAASASPRFAAALEYLLVETSPALRLRQRQRVDAAVPPGNAPIATTWADLPSLIAAPPFEGCLFANEVLDAFPVHRVVGTDEGAREIHVGARDGRLVELQAPLSSPDLAAFIHEAGIRLEAGQEVDLCLDAPRFLRQAGRLLQRGYFVLVDYGYEAVDLYHPMRRRGTLMAYHRHRVSEEFLARPGDQDLTAHVDWTAAEKAGVEAGLRRVGFTSQARFLLALGAVDFMEGAGIEEREALKDLMLPQRMGGLFRVLVLARGEVPDDLRGLSVPWAERAIPDRGVPDSGDPLRSRQSDSALA